MTDRRPMLVDVLCDVVEKMAFMFGNEASPEELPPAEEGYVKAHMTFSGPLNGRLTMVVAGEMCPELAANILGAEADDDRALEKSRDALKELLNITCGQILTTMAGEEPVFDLSVPQAEEIEAGEWKALADDPETAAVVADDFPVLLNLHVEE